VTEEFGRSLRDVTALDQSRRDVTALGRANRGSVACAATLRTASGRGVTISATLRA
jgi:hypothetical protein